MSQTLSHGVLLTEQAAIKVKDLIDREASETQLRLRLDVEAGGCAGMRYQLYFSDELSENDLIAEFGGVEVVIDPKSAVMVDGATIDYEDSIQKQGFNIDNPNAVNTCACGDSFS
ncbi:MAG: iron-sulfur cluster insertion protein ErpA [Actinomycetota bacterium]|jgi:iron-sulfur cluster assembly accessory protein